MPVSDPVLLLLGRVDLISSTTVQGALYGFAFTLYVFCARTLYLQLEDQERRRQHLFTLLYMSLSMALALSGVAVDPHDKQYSYIDRADYPGGGYIYSYVVFVKSPLAISGYVIAIMFHLMMSGIQIWRLWVIWRTSRYCFFIVMFPMLSLLTFLGLEIANAVVVVRSELTLYLDRVFVYGAYILLLHISVTSTVLIIVRILLVHKRNIKLIGQTDATNPYTSIISMLIESFALGSAWMVFSFDLGHSGPTRATGTFFGITRPLIQLLAYLLVVYRVTGGRGWNKDTAEKLTTLQWNRDGLQTTETDTRTSISIINEEA